MHRQLVFTADYYNTYLGIRDETFNFKDKVICINVGAHVK